MKSINVYLIDILSFIINYLQHVMYLEEEDSTSYIHEFFVSYSINAMLPQEKHLVLDDFDSRLSR